ncbi:hypothetical protein GS467_13895 [Rhodococcus hoagii]|nr:hypothetical protein [Prescottella equi]
MMNDAYVRLAAAVERAKDGSPLARVTVVVPNFGVSRDVLAFLARASGVANTRIATVEQVVTWLAAPVLAPRIPLPYPVLEGAVRKVLLEEPGIFVEVADQPITAQALADASRQLGSLPDLECGEVSSTTEDVIRIHRQATAAHSHRYYLPWEAYAAASANFDKLGQTIVSCRASRIR